MVTKVSNVLMLSGKEKKDDGGRSTFTPCLEGNLDDGEEEVKIAAEAFDKFHEIEEQPEDTLNPAVEAMRSLYTDDSPK